MYILIFIHLSYGSYPQVTGISGFQSEYACNYAGRLTVEKAKYRGFEFICVKNV